MRRFSLSVYFAKRTVAQATSVLIALAVSGGKALGQETAEGSPHPLEEIVVTGSRLAMPIGHTIVPVTVVNELDLQRGGLDGIGKALQRLPYNSGSPPNTNVNNGGDGSVRLDLRGFGPSRTLVLLNGRRIGFGGLGGDSSVDLNTIPASLVERVEISTGSSAIYGADAVAGVVNVITRRSFDGLEVEASYRSTEHGDGDIATARALYGFEGERGSMAIGVDLVDQAGVKQGARDYSRFALQLVTPDGPVVHGGSLTIPQGVFVVPDGNVFGLPGEFYTVVDGTDGSEAADFRMASPVTDTFNFSPFNYLQTPSKRIGGWLLGEIEVGTITGFAEAYFSSRDSDTSLAASPLATFEPGAAPAVSGGFNGQGVPASSYYNPFGVDVLFASRRTVEVGDRVRSHDVDAWRALVGLRGEQGDWSWELAAGRGDQDAEEVLTGYLLRSHTALALGPSGLDSSGNIVCGDPTPLTGVVPADQVISGCVPLDLFSGQGSDGKGTITPDMVSFISLPVVNVGANRQDLASLVVQGKLGRLPAGDIRAAFGIDWREEFTRFALDPLTADAGVAGGALTDVPGGVSFDALELFAEFELPLLARMPLADELEINVGMRYSDFSSFGSNTSLRGGLRWAFTPAVALRGNYSEVFRAPELGALHSSRVPSLGFWFDPCGNDPNPVQQQYCEANGVSGGAYAQNPAIPVPIVTGGNPQLEPESGESYGLGLVFMPPEFPEIAIALDYWRIELEDAIGEVSGETVLEECANRGLAKLCGQITRNADGSISLLDLTALNLGAIRGRGYDLAVDWLSETSWGDWSVNVLASYLDELETIAVPGSAAAPQAGRWSDDFGAAFPRWRSIGHVDWTLSDWRVSYGLEFIGSYDEASFALTGDTYERRIGSRLYHDVEAEWRSPWQFSIVGGISNLADEDPPLIFSGMANTDPATYRLLGRTYYFRLKWQG